MLVNQATTLRRHCEAKHGVSELSLTRCHYPNVTDLCVYYRECIVNGHQRPNSSLSYQAM